jgi:hypothetical protein
MVDTSVYTCEFRILASTWWHESDKSKVAMADVRKKLAARFDLPPPRGFVIRNWEEKLFSTGSVADNPRCGRPSCEEEIVERLSVAIEQEPHLSTRALAADVGASTSTVRKYLHQEGYKAFRPTFTQYLSADDEYDRMLACGVLLTKYPTPFSRRNFFFSDECAIYTDEKMSNLIWWSKENPHFTKQVKHHPPSLMVWAAMSSDALIGPFFVTGRVTSEVYVHLLETKFLPALMQRNIHQRAIFQQDGAPSHTSYAARQFLHQHFPNRWVGKFGPTHWPPRSPDLTSCDNALWGIIKHSVHAGHPSTTAELEMAIHNAFTKVTPDMLARIHERTWRRIALCVALDGKQVDPFDK